MKVEPENESVSASSSKPESAEYLEAASADSTSNGSLNNSVGPSQIGNGEKQSQPLLIYPKQNKDQNKEFSKEEYEEQELLEMARHELQKSSRSAKASRQRLSTRVTVALEKVFQVNHHPSIAIIRALAAKHNEDENRIKVWFRNRRGKQTRELIRKRIERAASRSKQLADVQQILQAQKEEPKARPLLPNTVRTPFVNLPSNSVQPPVIPTNISAAQTVVQNTDQSTAQNTDQSTAQNTVQNTYQNTGHITSQTVSRDLLENTASPSIRKTLTESQLMQPKIFLRHATVDLSDPSGFPMTFEFVFAMRERILQLQDLIRKKQSQSDETSSNNDAAGFNSMPKLRSSLCSMILKCLEPMCQSINAEGQFHVKKELNLPKALIKALLDVYRTLQAKGFGKLVLAKKGNTVISYLVVIADMFGWAFGEEHEGACIQVEDRIFRIERLVLSFDEDSGCLGVSAMLICQISPNY